MFRWKLSAKQIFEVILGREPRPKTLLITGMPRSGTSFLSLLPYMVRSEHPHSFVTERKNSHLHWAEPGLYAKDAKNLDTSEQAFRDLVEYNRQYSESLISVRAHELIYSLEIMEKFDEVIICSRQYESWLESARRHDDINKRVAERYEGKFFLHYSKMWRQIEYLRGAVGDSDKYTFVDFYAICEAKPVLYKRLPQRDVDDYFEENWLGSRFSPA